MGTGLLLCRSAMPLPFLSGSLLLSQMLRKFLLGHRPAPGTRAEFSKSKGTAMSCHQVPLVTHRMASLQDTLSALLGSQKEHTATDLFI